MIKCIFKLFICRLEDAGVINMATSNDEAEGGMLIEHQLDLPVVVSVKEVSFCNISTE